MRQFVLIFVSLVCFGASSVILLSQIPLDMPAHPRKRTISARQASEVGQSPRPNAIVRARIKHQAGR